MIDDDTSLIIRRNFCEDYGSLISMTFFIFDKEFTLDTAYGWLGGEGREENVYLEESRRTITIVYSGERIEMTGEVIPDYHYFDLVCVDVFEVETIEKVGEEDTYEIVLSSEPEVGGEVKGEGTFVEGEEVTLEAIPAEGYEFVNWTEYGEVLSDSKEYTFTVTEDRELVANFSSIYSFDDVPPGHGFFDYIEAIYAEGITKGVGGNIYGIDDIFTRGQMAAFLSRALGLHE